MTRDEMIEALRSIQKSAVDADKAQIDAVIAEIERTCACVEFDDGTSFSLCAFAGGAAPGGLFSSVNCVYTQADGTSTIMRYKREGA